jgi:Ser/Thr protein kinase RdoA (MazF antagonist)
VETGPSHLADRARDDALAAADAFGLRPARIDLQLSEEAVVARVRADSHDVAIKVFAADEVDEHLVRWRHEVAHHASARGLPVPAPLRTPGGSLTAALPLRGRTFLAQASAWSPGAALAEVPIDRALLREVGRTAALLSRALTDAPAPPAHEPHLWDMRRSGATLTEALSRVGDPEVRIVGLRALRAFHAVERRLEELPQGVVHQDLHDDNLRIAGDGILRRVVGILDFGDATFGPRIADLVIPAAYASRHCADPADAVEEVVEGWRCHVPLTPAERSVVTPLAAVRLATNAAVWQSRADGPRAEYAGIRSRGSLLAARALLDGLD